VQPEIYDYFHLAETGADAKAVAEAEVEAEAQTQPNQTKPN